MKTSTPWILLCVTAFACFAFSRGGYAACTEICDNSSNTGVGNLVFLDNVSGAENTAVGHATLQFNETGSDNTAMGDQALENNRVDGNTAVGARAMLTSTTGVQNVAFGSDALGFNTTGSSNAAIGAQSLFSNTSGYANTANGYQALYSNTTSGGNTGIGFQALHSNQDGNNNTAVGDAALYHNVSGEGNVAIGVSALANSTGPGANIAIGQAAGYNITTGVGNIDIGNQGVAGESGKIRIGTKASQNATYIAGISGKTVASASAVAVFIDNTGKLGTVKSSARFKDEIKPMEKASEALLKLEPVTFRYKKELGPDGVPQFGLVAEQVEKVNPDLVVCDEDGKVSTVRYEAVNAMLLNEFLKAHRTVEEQGAAIAQLNFTIAQQTKDLQAVRADHEKELQALTAQCKEQSSQIAKLNAEVERNSLSGRVAAIHH